MFFYDVMNKVGTAVQGWINDNYEAKASVKPRLYHKYLKDDDRANLYPIGILTVTSVAGTLTGDTSITVAETKTDVSNIYKYKVDVSLPGYKEDLSTWTTWDGTSEITPTSGAITICVAECDTLGIVLKAGITTIVAAVETNDDDKDPLSGTI